MDAAGRGNDFSTLVTLQFTAPFVQMMMDGTQLLRAFRQTRDETAFATLVRRYSNLVVGVARRRVPIPQLTEDIAQQVFVRLAQSPPEVASDAELLGWLHRTTLNAAIDAWRSHTRRQAREEIAAALNPPSHVPPAMPWESIAPILDESLNTLPPADREALLLRFFQERPLRDVGMSLGISEDAAKMRVSRALERLRSLLVSRGVGCTAAALAECLDQHALDSAASSALPALGAAHLLAKAGHALPAIPTTKAGLAASALFSKPTIIGVAALVLALGLGSLATYLNRNALLHNPANAAPKAVSVADPSDSSALRRRAWSIASTSRGQATLPEVDAQSLAEAETALRAVLLRPPASRSYPSRALTEVLIRFGSQVAAAIPILIDSATSDDYETRAWSLGGLQYVLGLFSQPANASRLTPEAAEAISKAHTALAVVVSNPNEPGFLRTLSVNALLPAGIEMEGISSTPPSLSPEVVTVLQHTLQRKDSRDEGFRYELVDAISRSLKSHNPALESFADLMRSQLASADRSGRALAAFALTTWPVEKPDSVKSELLTHLQSRTTHSYRAAAALGRLGPVAADAVPELLKYASEVSAFQQGPVAPGQIGYSALEAACRIDPSLRAQYPEIDRRLLDEEAIHSGRSVATHESIGDWAVQLVLNGGTEPYLSMLQDQPNPEEARAKLVSLLETALATAAADRKPDLQKALDAVRNTPIPNPNQSETFRSVGLGDLSLTARVLLTDNPTSHDLQIESFLERFHEPGKPSFSTPVTPENFESVSKGLRAIDPAFEQSWRSQVRKDYPWLDRTIPGL